MARTASPRVRNHLLAALPEVFDRIKGKFERVEMPLRQRLSKPAAKLSHVYFPLSGMISLVQSLKDGTTIEVGLIGREGFQGVPLLHGSPSSLVEAMVQAEGEALRMGASDFLAAVAEESELRLLLLKYAHALFTQVTQTAVCNGRHSMSQRLARWLLEAHDRIASNDLALSHEFISLMLGARRPTVTLALGLFKSEGYVVSGHGKVKVKNRKGLESAACECYRTVQGEYIRLLS